MTFPWCIDTWEGVLMVTMNIVVLFQFAWKMELSAIINPAKIGMIFYMPMLQKSNHYVSDIPGSFYIL